MKTIKLNLTNIREKLSKQQMKQLLAGSDGCVSYPGQPCSPPYLL